MFYKKFNKLKFKLGRNQKGEVVFCDLMKTPHLLIADVNNTGKTYLLRNMIESISKNNNADFIKFLLVDAKGTEFGRYLNNQNLYGGKIYSQFSEVIEKISEIDALVVERFNKFANAHVRNLAEYNKISGKKLPYIVVVFDEFADYITYNKTKFEAPITNIAMRARAAGVHIILSTRVINTNVITGLIKANFISRIAFATTSKQESKIIIDEYGAEELKDQEFLYLPCNKLFAQQINQKQ